MGRDATDTDGDSVLGTPDTELGEGGTLRWVARLSTYEQPARLNQTAVTDTACVDGPTYLSLQCLLRDLKGLKLIEDLV